MSKVQQVLHAEFMAGLQEESIMREVGRGIFEDWRDRYAAYLCQYIRLYASARRGKAQVPEAEWSMAWCNAAVHLLTVGDELLQDFFLRADPRMKDRLVAAVLQDGGITNLAGFFVELPPL